MVLFDFSKILNQIVIAFILILGLISEWKKTQILYFYKLHVDQAVPWLSLYMTV